MNECKLKLFKLILSVHILVIIMFIASPLQVKALEQQGFTLEVWGSKLCNSPFLCFGDGEVEYNPNLRAYIVRDQSKTYYAAVRVRVGGCGNTASDTAVVLTFDQMTSSFGLRTKLDGFADDKSTAVHGDFTDIPFKSGSCGEDPPYEYKLPSSNQDRGFILDTYENDNWAECSSVPCDQHGYPYKCPFPLQRRDRAHYSTDLGRFSGLRQLSSIEKFQSIGTDAYIFYVPFNFNVVDGGMSENIHTIKTFAWARMDHFSIPERVYMWEWNDPGGRIKVAPAFIQADFKAEPRCGSKPLKVTLTATVTQTTESGIYTYSFNCGNGGTPAVTTQNTSASVDCNYDVYGTYNTSVTITQGKASKTLGPIRVEVGDGLIFNTATGFCEKEICTSGKTKCEGETHFECENGDWVDKGIVVGQCGVECYPLGATRSCEGGGIQTCQSG